MMFLRKIMHAIAQRLISLTQPLGVFAQPTPNAGRANKVRTTPTGNKRSAQASTQPRPVKPAVKAKSVRARRDTTAQSQALEQALAQQQQEAQSGEHGFKQLTPASQPAYKSQTRKRSVALSIPQEPSRKQEPKPAQTTSGKRGRPRKTPV